MKRPSAFDFVFGHRTTVWLATGATIVSTCAWLTHAISWLAPLVALAARNGCISARGRVVTWRNWTDAWQEMAAPASGAQTLAGRPALAPVATAAKAAEPCSLGRKPRTIPRSALILAWLALLAWFTVHRNDAQTPGDGVFALLLIALTGWGALAAVASLGRRVLRTPARTPIPRAAEPVPAPDEFVAQSLPPARNEVPPGHISDLLPGYARSLLARRREALDPAIPYPNTESE